MGVITGRRPNDARVSLESCYLLYGVTVIACLLMTVYLIVRVGLTITDADYTAADAVMAALLLGAEVFLCMHGLGYFFNVMKAGRRHQTLEPIVFAKHVDEPVAVLVAAFNESEQVLEDTLASIRAVDYPVHVYLLDDSTKPEYIEGARRVSRKYGAQLFHRTHRIGYKAGAINEVIPQLSEKYIALLDADQRPCESWLKEVVAYMGERPRLAVVQTPQHYVNDKGLPVCSAARYQQAVFFEYICDGKAYSNAMFCCGSNCVLRRDALLSIATVVDGRTHYFDETSVTEDFTTSLRLHLKGWETDYVNETYAVGLGPETVRAQFTQHMRWAMGTQGETGYIIKQFFCCPRALMPAQWWEYWLGATYFFKGIPDIIFMVAPIAFVLFDIRPVRSDPRLYLMFFIPYFVFSMNLFFLGMKLRGYSALRVWLASALSFSTFWIYTKAATVTLLGLKRPFAVTPKNVGGAVPLRHLGMELTMLMGNWATSLWCMYCLILTGGSLAYAVNGAWATYHAILLSTLFLYFNRPVKIRRRPPLFEAALMS